MTLRTFTLAAVLVLSPLCAPFGSAQSLGAFQWQLAPYCNVVSVHITQFTSPPGASYAFTGLDDQCGGTLRATVSGTATFHLDGSIAIGLTTITAPGATPIHVNARIALATLRGPWVDSAGNSGTLVPVAPSTTAAGLPRPVPPNGIAPGSITAAQLAPGSIGPQHIAPGSIGIGQLAPGVVGNAQIDPNQVQSRVTGSCPLGQYLRGIRADGGVVCEPVIGGNLTTPLGVPIGSTVRGPAPVAVGADGYPVVAFHDDAGLLRVTHCGNAACTAGNVTTTVDALFEGVGGSAVIAIGADGYPVVGHVTVAGVEPRLLRVAHCGDMACSAGNTAVTVDNDVAGLGRTAMTIGRDGVPIFAYQAATVAALRVTHCGTATCSGNNVSTTVADPPHHTGLSPSIAIRPDGLPIIAHRVELQPGVNKALRVTACASADCASAIQSTDLVQSGGPLLDVGLDATMAIAADGLPVVGHLSSSSNGTRNVFVFYCSTARCDSPSTSLHQYVETAGRDTTVYVSFTTDRGVPVFATYNEAPGEQLLTRCSNAACDDASVDDRPTTVVVHAAGGGIPRLAVGTDGLPIITHWNPLSRKLRVTKCATTTCK